MEYLSLKTHKTPFPFLISRKDLLKLNTITFDMMTSVVLSEKDKKACYHSSDSLLSELTAFRARYFRGVLTLGGSLFSGTKNHEAKLALALSRNEK